MDLQQTCCFTGHRPERLPFRTDESHSDCVKLKEQLSQEIERLITGEGVRHFISGMTAGTDLTAAELVLELKKKYPQITLESAIPYEEQAIKWTAAQRNNTTELPDSAMKASHCRPPMPVTA